MSKLSHAVLICALPRFKRPRLKFQYQTTIKIC